MFYDKFVYFKVNFSLWSFVRLNMICFVSILLVLFAPPLLTTSETTIASDISEDDNFDKVITGNVKLYLLNGLIF